MRFFKEGGFGRIYVDIEENIKKVESMIYEKYKCTVLPDLVTAYDHYPGYVSLGDWPGCNLIDLDYFTIHCWKKGVYIACMSSEFCVENSGNESTSGCPKCGHEYGHYYNCPDIT